MHLVAPFEDWTIRGRWWPVTLRRRKKAIAVVFHHAVTNTTDRTDLEQIQDVEEVIYRRRWRSRFSMFAYCYGLSTGARAYEGRGTKYRNAANNDTKGTGYDNGNTISIVLCGNYENNVPGIPTLTPTDAQAKMAAALIRELVTSGVLVDDPAIVILGHNHVHSTACPGDNVEGAWLEKVRDLVAFGTVPDPDPFALITGEDMVPVFDPLAGAGAGQVFTIIDGKIRVSGKKDGQVIPVYPDYAWVLLDYVDAGSLSFL